MKDMPNDSRLYIIENSDVDIKGQLFRGNILNISEFTLNPCNEIHLKNMYDYLKPGIASVFYAPEYCLEEIKKISECLKDTKGYKIIILSNNQNQNIELDEFDLIIYVNAKDSLGQYYFAERLANTMWAIMNETCVIGMNGFDYDSVMDKSKFQSYLIQNDINIDCEFEKLINERINNDTKKVFISFEGNLERFDIVKISSLLEKLQNIVDEKADIHFTVVDCKYKYDYEIIVLVE